MRRLAHYALWLMLGAFTALALFLPLLLRALVDLN